MQTSLLKQLAIVALMASTYAITGCNDANSKNPAPSQMNAADTATTSVTPNTQASEEAKRNAESGNALY
jgi:hypothetical protein